MGGADRLRALGVYALAALVSACGGEVTGRKSSVDGPPANSADGGGGVDGSVDGGGPIRLTVQSQGWGHVQVRDEAKNVVCYPTLAADGTERCLPIGGGPSVVFTDSACTHPVISFTPDPCSAPPTYLAHTGGLAGCLIPETAMYTLGAAITAPPTVYNQNDGFCTLMADATAPAGLLAGPFYEAVSSDPTDWVKLTRNVVKVTEALAVASWKGADGSLIPDGFQLLPSGTPCDVYPALPTDAEIRCIPTLRAQMSGEVFANDQCTGDRLAGSCAPTDVMELGSGFDASGASIGGLFQTVTAAPPVYFPNPFASNVCMALPPSPQDPSHYYSIGPPLPLDRYPLLALTVEGTGRLQTEYLTTEGKTLLDESLYDSAYGEACGATQLSDGGTWCVPDTVAFFQGTYADAGCTVPLGLGGSPTTHPQWGLVFTPSSSACSGPPPPTLYSTVPHSGPVYERGQPGPGSCYLVIGIEALAEQSTYALGKPLDPSQVLAPVRPL